MSDARTTDRAGARFVRLSLALLLAACGRPPWCAAAGRVTLKAVAAEQTVSGELESLTESGATVRTAAGSQQEIVRGDLQSLSIATESDDHQAESPRPEWRVWLTNGDVGTAPALRSDGEMLRLQTVAAGDWAVPLEFVRGLARVTGDDPADTAAARRVLRTTADADTLLLVNGDRVSGELVVWEEAGVQWETAAGTRLIAAADVAGLLLDPNLTTAPPRAAVWSVVQTRTGERISCGSVTLDGDRWELRPECGGDVNLPWSAVARIDFFGERVQPLMCTPPPAFSSAGTLTPTGRYELHHSVCGGPLSLRGDRGGWGVGVGSGSRLVWELDGSWSRFETMVGLDDAAGDSGSVEFVVQVDGVERGRTGVVRGGETPVALGPIEIRGARRLELLVTPADRGDIRDFADWLRPTLVR